MGIFSNLGDVLSGKIYRQNALLGSNVAKLLEKFLKLPDDKFIKHWAFACVSSCHVSLDYLLFGKDGKEINTFKKHIDKLNEEKVFEVIKLLTGHYLTVFKHNESNVQFLNKFNMNIGDLEVDVFANFLFTRDDEKIFRELDKEFGDDSTRYFLHLYQKIFEKAYEMSNKKDVFGSMFMTSIISNSYTGVFLQILTDKLKEK